MSRQLWDFHGGVHPWENKTQSSRQAIQTLPLPDELIFPIPQTAAGSAQALVAVGDQVYKGQALIKTPGFMTAPIHASTSGQVTAIESRPTQHPSALDSLCIVIEPDGNDQWIDTAKQPQYRSLDKATVIEQIHNAGITGMGGAGFPAAIKLQLPPERKLHYLIANGAECEPYITADDRLMQERSEAICKGLAISQWLLEPKTTLIAIEDNKPAAIAAMQEAVAKHKLANTEVVSIPTKYPSGGEKQLIQILTGQEVPSGGLPRDLGIVCQNVGTLYAIQRAVTHGEPLISRVMTITGDEVGKKGNYDVLLGSPIRWLLEQTATPLKPQSRLIIGGPMMGFTLHDLAAPVTRTSNCLLVPATNELPAPEREQPCIRCASCEQVCPAQLLPQQLYWAAKTDNLDLAERYHLSDCIECGACAYVCPSHIPLVQYYRYAKGQIRETALANAKADHARERFAFRQARLEQEEQEKEAKRKARAEANAKKQAAKKAAAAATANNTAKPETDNPRLAVDPVTALKAAAAKASKRWKDAEKACEKAAENNPEQRERLQQKVAQLKTKADQANQAFVAARKAAQSKPEATSRDPD